MIACAHKLGRQEAHEILRTLTSRTDFVQALRADPRISSVMTSAELDVLLDPRTYIGLAPQIVDSVVAKFGVSPAPSFSSTSSSSSPSVPTSSSSSSSSSSSTTPLTYAAAGVSIDAGDALVEAIKPLAKSTRRAGADADLGGFGGLFDLAALRMKDPLLVACTDGVGTKLALAKIAGRHDTIGVDLVAMSVNDLIVQGAQPLLFLDYFACSRLSVEDATQVVKGVAAACVESGCALVGGETAELPGMYQPGDYDLAGFAVGAVERDAVLPQLERMRVGDTLIGVASAGVHSNGFSLVRRVVADAQADWLAPAPFASSLSPLARDVVTSRLCDELLIPTKLYVKSTLASIPHGIKGLAHITGGGLIDNLPRVLPAHLAAHIECGSWPVPPVFHWLSGQQRQRQGAPVETSEMIRTFNLGIGMVAIVSAEQVEAVRASYREHGEQTFVIGTLQSRPDGGKPVEMHLSERLFAAA